MKLRAVIKSGILNGLLLGSALHVMALAAFYQYAYQVQLAPLTAQLVDTVLPLVALVAFLAIAPCAVMWAQYTIQSVWDGIQVGAGAGLLVGLLVYLMVGVLGNTLFVGTIPFASYLEQPELLPHMEYIEMLKPAMWNTMSATYLLMFLHFFLGALIGGFQGMFITLLRFRNKQEHYISPPIPETPVQLPI